MKLQYLTNLFATKHYVGSALSLDSYSRRLQLNQAEAAKRVDDAVDQAMSSVKNGDVAGVALPLNYVALSKELGGQQQLTVNLRLPGVDRNQNIMIDTGMYEDHVFVICSYHMSRKYSSPLQTTTGSSSLAFCNKSLAEEATDINKVNYAQCIKYGGYATCPDNSTGNFLFYVGQVYQGDVGAYNNQGEEITSLSNVSLTIIDEVQQYACFGPLDGIIGVAFDKINWGFVAEPSLDFDAMSLWNESCKNPNQDLFSIGYESVGNCDTENLTETTLPSPLEATLSQAVESGYNKAEVFGLYLDYAATIGSKTNTIIPSLGAYFGGDLALNNQYYNNGNVQVAQQLSCVGQNAWYVLNFTSIRVPGLNLTQSTTEKCGQDCSQGAQCITDSGNSYLQLPLSVEFCKSVPTNVDKLKSLGSLYIDLDGGNVTLSLPLLWLWEQIALGHASCTGTSGSFVLGLPISQYYYLVYNMGNNTVVFVDLELSNDNETESFIDSGGTSSTSAGYLLYQALTASILVLTASCIYLWN